MRDTTDPIQDAGVAGLIDLARSANVYLELVNDRVTVRAIDPHWAMWRPVSRLLDELGLLQIEEHLRAAADIRCAPQAIAPWPGLRETTMRWAKAIEGRR